MPMLGVDADSVRALFIAGMSTAAIAATYTAWATHLTRFAMIHMYGPEES
jgi:hypothetical protein